MKLASIFIKASAVNIRVLPQISLQTGKKHEVYVNVFYSSNAKKALLATADPQLISGTVRNTATKERENSPRHYAPSEMRT